MHPEGRADLGTMVWDVAEEARSCKGGCWPPWITRRPQHGTQRCSYITGGHRHGKLALGCVQRGVKWQAAVRFNRMAKRGDEKQTDRAGAATASGRGADDQAEQHRSLQGALRCSSAQPPREAGVMLPRVRTAGWKQRTNAGTSGLSLVTWPHPRDEAI